MSTSVSLMSTGAGAGAAGVVGSKRSREDEIIFGKIAKLVLERANSVNPTFTLLTQGN